MEGGGGGRGKGRAVIRSQRTCVAPNAATATLGEEASRRPPSGDSYTRSTHACKYPSSFLENSCSRSYGGEGEGGGGRTGRGERERERLYSSGVRVGCYAGSSFAGTREDDTRRTRPSPPLPLPPSRSTTLPSRCARARGGISRARCAPRLPFVSFSLPSRPATDSLRPSVRPSAVFLRCTGSKSLAQERLRLGTSGAISASAFLRRSTSRDLQRACEQLRSPSSILVLMMTHRCYHYLIPDYLIIVIASSMISPASARS